MAEIGQDEARARVDAAYDALLCNDRYLLEVDANERSITHKLAEYLQREFPGWNTDCEYNRSGDLPKTLRRRVGEWVRADDTEARSVFPDIIVHRRGPSKPNLLVVEAKKSTTQRGSDDEEKLRAYLCEYHYQFAYMVIFRVGGHACDAAAEEDITEIRKHSPCKTPTRPGP